MVVRRAPHVRVVLSFEERQKAANLFALFTAIDEREKNSKKKKNQKTELILNEQGSYDYGPCFSFQFFYLKVTIAFS